MFGKLILLFSRSRFGKKENSQKVGRHIVFDFDDSNSKNGKRNLIILEWMDAEYLLNKILIDKTVKEKIPIKRKIELGNFF